MIDVKDEMRKALEEKMRAAGVLEIHKMFEEYKKVTGGKNGIGRHITRGYPKGLEEHGGIVNVYRECIEKKITWEELLGYKHAPEGALE